MILVSFQNLNIELNKTGIRLGNLLKSIENS